MLNVIWWAVCATHGQERGLAAKYPNGFGIGRDRAVLLHDDFEGEPLGGKWDETVRRENREAKGDDKPVRAETDRAIARRTRSARVQLRIDGYEDDTLVKWLRPGYEELFMRHYVRYGSDYGFQGHGGSGFMAEAGKGGFKGAGKAPDGDKFFWATLEPTGRPGRWPWESPGAVIFYAYWRRMKPDARGDYWGNCFQPEPDQVPQRETWVCVGWRVKANKAGKEEGELDCWIDGKKCGRFRGIRWRATDALRVNKVQLPLWLEAAAYARAGGGTTRTVWYDDGVVATQYIGPKSPYAVKCQPFEKWVVPTQCD